MIDQTEIAIVATVGEAVPWPVYWSSIWVGALASIAAITIIGLTASAIGVGTLQDVHDFSTWHEITLVSLISVIFGVFFAYVVGGWVAGKIMGARIAEPAILHAAISWLVTIPVLLVLLALGAGKAFGGWYGALGSSIVSSPSATVILNPMAIRHTATAAITVLLLGLIGSVIGGWMACGEPMSITHHKTRGQLVREKARHV